MDEDAIARAKQRLEQTSDPATFDAALERARAAVEALAATTAQLEAGIPDAIEEGIRHHFRPSARHLAEVRGLMNQVIRRLERIEGDISAERHARIDDLALLVDLIAAGWHSVDSGVRSVDDRIAQLEERLQREGAVVYRLEDARPAETA
jgi:hypothetical protein